MLLLFCSMLSYFTTSYRWSASGTSKSGCVDNMHLYCTVYWCFCFCTNTVSEGDLHSSCDASFVTSLFVLTECVCVHACYSSNWWLLVQVDEVSGHSGVYVCDAKLIPCVGTKLAWPWPRLQIRRRDNGACPLIMGRFICLPIPWRVMCDVCVSDLNERNSWRRPACSTELYMHLQGICVGIRRSLVR
jgi:hypothetical protein